MKTLLIILSFSFGIVIESIGNPSFWISAATVLIIIILFYIFTSKEYAIIAALAGCCFFIGLFRVRLVELPFTEASLLRNNFEAEVIIVDKRATSTLLYVLPEGEKVRALVRVYRQLEVLPGDRIFVEGKVQEPESFITDTGREFNYPKYLASKGILYVVNAASVTKMNEGKGIIRFFAKLNNRTEAILKKTVPYPIDVITAGMVVGERGGINDDVMNLFTKTGTLHLLVLSGYNITLLVTFIGLLLRRSPFYLKIGILSLSIISLVLLSGAGIAAVRAGIMGLIVLLGQVTGRTYTALRALVVTFFLLLLWNPLLLLYDPGFQLSFLATLCMIVVVPRVATYFKKIPKTIIRLPLQEIVTVTVTVSLFMLPFIAYFSGAISLLTIPANFIAAFFVPLITILGILTIIVGVVIPPLGIVLGGMLGIIGRILLGVLQGAAKVKEIIIPPFSVFYMVLIYIVIFGILFWKKKTGENNLVIKDEGVIL